MGGFNSLIRGATLADERVKQLNRSQRALHETFRGGLGIVALASAGAMFAGIKGAADLQVAMVGVQTATRGTAAEMERLTGLAFKVSDATNQSVVDSANVLKVLGRSGFTAPQIEVLGMDAAKFADVQLLSRKVTFEEGANQAATLAHMFRKYGTDSKPIFDMAAALSKMQPDGLAKSITQMGYFVPTFKSLGVSDVDSFATMAILSRTGYGKGKGGTGMANLLMDSLGPLQQTLHAQKGKRRLLGQWGILDDQGHNRFFHQTKAFGQLASKSQLDAMTPEQLSAYAMKMAGKAKFDFVGMLTQIAKYALTPEGLAKGQDKLTSELISMFGKQGGRMALLALDPQFISQITAAHKRLADSMRGEGAVAEMQRKYLDTFWGQFGRMRTNLYNVLIDMSGPMLKPFKEFFKLIADNASAFQGFIHEHRAFGNAISAAIGAIGIAAGLAFIAMGRLGLAMTALPSAIDRLSAALLRLGVAAETAGAEAGAGAAAAGAGGAAGLLKKVPIAGVVGSVVGAAILYDAADRWHKVSPAGKAGKSEQDYQQDSSYRHDKSGNRILPNGLVISPSGQYIKPTSIVFPNATSIKAPTSAKKTHSGQVSMVQNFHYHAAPGNDAQSKRHALDHARKVANETARVIGSTMRTSMRSAGSTIATLGMSPLELNPSV